jgi:cobalt-zinc-cadmium efflux system outer membrane protein
MGNRKRLILWITALLFAVSGISTALWAQSEMSVPYINIGLKEYLELVLVHNLELAAERYNLSIAEAEVAAARVFPDPTLSFEWGRDGGENSYTTELEQTIELGKRRARIDLARSGQNLAHAQFNDFLRNLLADATIAYLEAMKNRNLYEVTENSYQMLKQLAQADSIRLSLGIIMSIDAMQSKLEAGMLYNELMVLDAEQRNAFANLSNHIGIYHADTLYFPTQEFERVEKVVSFEQLLETALRLIRAERRMDIDLKVGATNSKLNSHYLSPTDAEITAGIAIPLKFSNLNKAEVRIAQYELEQSELNYKSLEIAVKNEVLQAYNRYQAIMKQVKNFDFGLLKQAKAVLEGKTYSYSRGESSLLEVLDAQRTYNEVNSMYYQTMYDYHTALVELERACGAKIPE